MQKVNTRHLLKKRFQSEEADKRGKERLENVFDVAENKGIIGRN